MKKFRKNESKVTVNGDLVYIFSLPFDYNAIFVVAKSWLNSSRSDGSTFISLISSMSISSGSDSLLNSTC